MNIEAIKFVDSPDFRHHGADGLILGPVDVGPAPVVQSREKSGMNWFLGAEMLPVLSREREVYWFRRMNYLKFKAVVAGSDDDTPEAAELVGKLLAQAADARNLLISSNLRLVVWVIKRLPRLGLSFSELMSEGNTALWRAVELFDYSLGFKFSSYAIRAIKIKLRGAYVKERRHRARFHPFEDLHPNDESPVLWADPRCLVDDERLNRQHKAILGDLLACLPVRERQIVSARFGVAGCDDGQTFGQIGESAGVTGERIRQIECRALRRLRQAAVGVDIPGF